jgi:hypothetical protein
MLRNALYAEVQSDTGDRITVLGKYEVWVDCQFGSHTLLGYHNNAPIYNIDYHGDGIKHIIVTFCVFLFRLFSLHRASCRLCFVRLL